MRGSNLRSPAARPDLNMVSPDICSIASSSAFCQRTLARQRIDKIEVFSTLRGWFLVKVQVG